MCHRLGRFSLLHAATRDKQLERERRHTYSQVFGRYQLWFVFDPRSGIQGHRDPAFAFSDVSRCGETNASHAAALCGR